MKIYLAVPLQKNRNNQLAKEIHKILIKFGCQVLSEWVLWDNPNPNLDPKGIYERNYKAIKTCDLLIAEASNPSIGVGMEVMYAHILGKKIVCVYMGTNISNMVKGLPGIILLNYVDLNDLAEKLGSEIHHLNS